MNCLTTKPRSMDLVQTLQFGDLVKWMTLFDRSENVVYLGEVEDLIGAIGKRAREFEEQPRYGLVKRIYDQRTAQYIVQHEDERKLKGHPPNEADKKKDGKIIVNVDELCLNDLCFHWGAEEWSGLRSEHPLEIDHFQIASKSEALSYLKSQIDGLQRTVEEAAKDPKSIYCRVREEKYVWPVVVEKKKEIEMLKLFACIYARQQFMQDNNSDYRKFIKL